ncbi:MAG: DNA replication/repair protein RecF [Ruminococcaceae bacterium]|nr:DNA replication/repair protein RecF [Oscillospiraceae bacterium]
MRVTKIKYYNFRNLYDCETEFSDGINVLWGMNAQGKSNILEGIYYFARGRSFRGAGDRELITFGDSFARMELSCLREGAEHEIKLEAVLPKAGKRSLYRNGAKLTSVVEMLGSFRAVLFCPAHLNIVTGGPLERRTFLDIAISQLSPAYLTYLRRYSKILAERNALLKLASGGRGVTPGEWEVYAWQMAECAAEIAAYRMEYVEILQDAVEEYFNGMTDGREKPALVYQSHVPTEELPKPLMGDVVSSAESAKKGIFEKLTANVDREIAYGATLWGIHKDEVRLLLNGKEAKLYGSQGQQRSMVLSMKLAEGQIARQVGGEYPCLLLDDVFSELDEERRRYILGKISGRQIIVTSCEPDIIPVNNYDGDIAFHHVVSGNVE